MLKPPIMAEELLILPLLDFFNGRTRKRKQSDGTKSRQQS